MKQLEREVMKMIKNIVFDLGNVLIEFNPLKYLEKFEFDEKTKKYYIKLYFKVMIGQNMTEAYIKIIQI